MIWARMARSRSGRNEITTSNHQMGTLLLQWNSDEESARSAQILARRLRDELKRFASQVRGPQERDGGWVVTCWYSGMEFQLRLRVPERRWRLEIECPPPPVEEQLSWDAEELPAEVLGSFEERIERLVCHDPMVRRVGWDM